MATRARTSDLDVVDPCIFQTLGMSCMAPAEAAACRKRWNCVLGALAMSVVWSMLHSLRLLCTASAKIVCCGILVSVCTSRMRCSISAQYRTNSSPTTFAFCRSGSHHYCCCLDHHLGTDLYTMYIQHLLSLSTLPATNALLSFAVLHEMLAWPLDRPVQQRLLTAAKCINAQVVLVHDCLCLRVLATPAASPEGSWLCLNRFCIAMAPDFGWR